MDIKLHMGDCIEYMKSMPDKSIDAIITDPPYGVDIAEWDNELPSQYFLDECLRIATGTIIWFGGAKRILDFGKYNPNPDRTIIWYPKFTLLKINQDGIAFRYHPIYIWRIIKQDVIVWDVLQDITELGNWWKHPATKPLSLMRKLVEGFSTQSVFDPFMGSGTTGVAAKQIGRDFIGCENNPEYFKICEKRINEASTQESYLKKKKNKSIPSIDMFGEINE